MNPVLAWFLPTVPRARLAWFRAVVAVTAVLDTLLILSSPRDRAGSAAYYAPVLLARVLHLPPPTVGLAWALQLAVLLGALGLVLAGLRRAPAALLPAAGVLLSVTYLLWCTYGMSFGYVAHDHMAIAVAAVVLPLAGPARYADVDRSATAGWALRTVQLFTVATYTGSVLAKWVESGHDLVRWASSGTLAWAFLRRPSTLNQLLVDHAPLLRTMQWGGLVLELLAPAVFLVPERRRWLVAAAYVGFHLTTFLLLGIHFLPTFVCWAAFLPLERLRREAWPSR